jgi:hypothetical protein
MKTNCLVIKIFLIGLLLMLINCGSEGSKESNDVQSNDAQLDTIEVKGFGEWIDNGDGTVSDKKAGLMWQKAATEKKDWNGAISYCEDLTLAGYSDWHLPKVNELRTLIIDCPATMPEGGCGITDGCNDTCWSTACTGCGNACHMDVIFEGSCYEYWSSSSFSLGMYGGGAFFVDFSNGKVSSHPQSSIHPVRCVR